MPLKLRAYNSNDLQKVKNILMQVQVNRISIPEALDQINRAIDTEAVTIRRTGTRRVKNKHTEAELPTRNCPECIGGRMRLYPADERNPDLALWGCPKCRYSEFEGKTFMEYLGEASR